MKKKLLGSLFALLASTGISWGQSPLADSPTQIPSALDTGSPILAGEGGPGACSQGGCPSPCFPRAWVSGEYLLWWLKSGPSPQVTTSSDILATSPTSGQNISGALGLSSTSLLYGGSGISYDALSGGRLTAGMWLDQEGTCGFEGRGFLLQKANTSASFSSDAGGNPLIALPIVDTRFNENNSFLTSYPGFSRGTLTVTSSSQLWGAEANGLVNLVRSPYRSVDALVGFRYANLNEQLQINSTQSNLVPVGAGGGAAFLGTFFDGTTSATDIFQARNQFYGGQVGARGEWLFGNLILNLTGKVALGATNQTVNIQGNSSILAGGSGYTSLGGTYALPSNIGQSSHTAFTVIPEVEAKIGYQFGTHLRAFVGYNFMYWSSVARPGDQIDQRIDPRVPPTSNIYSASVNSSSPARSVQTSDFWAQGVNFGIEIRY